MATISKPFICLLPNLETIDFDPQGDVLLRLTRRHEKVDVFDTNAELIPLSTSTAKNTPDQELLPVDDAPLSLRTDTATSSANQTVLMRVSSRNLVLASPIFAAMLDKNKFKEGITLHAQGSVDIELPDDNPDAVSIVLNIVHGFNRLVPRALSLPICIQVAILVNKYDLLEAVELFSHIWIKDLWHYDWGNPFVIYDQREAERERCMTWLFISWVFVDFELFREVTETLIMQADHAMLEDDLENALAIPHTILDAIRGHRVKVIDDLLSITNALIEKYSGRERQCQPLDPALATDPAALARCDICDMTLLGSIVKATAHLPTGPRPIPPFVGVNYSDLPYDMAKLQLRSGCSGSLKSQTLPPPCCGIQAKIDDSLAIVRDGLIGLNVEDFKSSKPRSHHRT